MIKVADIDAAEDVAGFAADIAGCCEWMPEQADDRSASAGPADVRIRIAQENWWKAI
jgi:hypothetical protein